MNLRAIPLGSWRPAVVEDSASRLARWAAAGMTISAGLIHLAQVRTHAEEDWTFVLFFVVVGCLQTLGGVYLAVPVGPPALVRWIFRVGIAGSLGTIAIWAVSRTLGLPFGAEPGQAETVGLADAAADVFELLTAWLLLLWLRGARRADATLAPWAAAGAGLALALAALWVVTRRVGIFDPDPRLVALPQLTDAAALAFLLLAATFFLLLTFASGSLAAQRVPALSLLAALAVAELSLVAFTLPARGGQNLDCRYGPLADDSGLSHSEPPEPVELHIGETRSVVVLQLVACSAEPVELTAVRPLHVQGEAARILGFRIDRERAGRAARVAPAGGGVQPAGVRIEPGQGRYPLAVEVVGEGDGAFFLHAVEIEYTTASARSAIAFATFGSFCIGEEHCTEER